MEEMVPSDPKGKYYQHLKGAIETTSPESSVFPIMIPSYNDVGMFRLQGIQGYSIIPIELDLVLLECVHGVNERIPIKSLSQGINTYQAFIENCMEY